MLLALFMHTDLILLRAPIITLLMEHQNNKGIDNSSSHGSAVL